MAFLEEGVEALVVDSGDTACGVADRQMRIIVQLWVVSRRGVAEGNGRRRLDEFVGLGAVKVCQRALSVQGIAQCRAGTAVVVLEGGVKTITVGAAPCLVDVLGIGSGADIDALVADIVFGVVAVPHQGTAPARCLEAVDGRCEIDVVLFVHVHANADLLEIRRAGNGARFVTCLGQGGKQHGGQNRDDCDDDQQFNQGEAQHFFHLHLLLLSSYRNTPFFDAKADKIIPSSDLSSIFLNKKLISCRFVMLMGVVALLKYLITMVFDRLW